MGSDPEENRRLVRRYFDLLNGGDRRRRKRFSPQTSSFFGPRAPEGVRGRDALIEFVLAL
jgi:hypothetical protein